MDSRYNHLEHEDQVYQRWESAQAFNPDTYRNQADQTSPFTIIMPPPNANDPLHIGHAMFIAIEDTLIRYHRMLGDDTLWLPGTDHAGIETQFVFEKKLKKEGKSRFNFDRKTLYDLIWNYVQENSEVAKNQMKKLGASADWSRFQFTLNPEIIDTVLDTFVKLYEDPQKLIYRDLKLVNFCTHCGTSYSELEVNYVDRVDPLYFVKYPLENQTDSYVTVATVRPEPIFADTHLAVNPADPKNRHLIGQRVLNPLTDQPMPIIGDEFVDPEFGTGVVKLTPAHDANDFAVAQKHNLPLVSAIGFDGKMTPNAGELAGLKVEQARAVVVQKLTEKGLIDKVKNDYSHRVGTCYRCGRVLEPLLRPQFFIKVKPLVERVLAGLKNQEITIYGAGHDKILHHWLTNLRDWNISRQIVWGIRIPVWYPITDHLDEIIVSFIDNQGHFHQGPLAEWLEDFSLAEIKEGLQQVLAMEHVPFVVSLEEPTDQEYLPETDTFDTWFSSGQWPVATLQNTKPGDFERFYPTSLMETGYDILPFWVMRMMLLGYYLTDETPFKQVYLHGLVRDAKGQKMSKSKGNVVNPLEVVEKYGADALRMALIIRSTPGLDKSVGEPDFKAMRNFTNKLWNAARFVIDFDQTATPDSTQDQAFSKKLQEAVDNITQQLNDLKVGLAAETAYNEFWHWYCDECIEQAKKGQLSQAALVTGLVTFLKLLHPFVPFVTEAIWTELPTSMKDSPLLIASSWPSNRA